MAEVVDSHIARDRTSDDVVREAVSFYHPTLGRQELTSEASIALAVQMSLEDDTLTLGVGLRELKKTLNIALDSLSR